MNSKVTTTKTGQVFMLHLMKGNSDIFLITETTMKKIRFFFSRAISQVSYPRIVVSKGRVLNLVKSYHLDQLISCNFMLSIFNQFSVKENLTMLHSVGNK